MQSLLADAEVKRQELLQVLTKNPQAIKQGDSEGVTIVIENLEACSITADEMKKQHVDLIAQINGIMDKYHNVQSILYYLLQTTEPIDAEAFHKTFGDHLHEKMKSMQETRMAQIKALHPAAEGLIPCPLSSCSLEQIS